MSTTTVDAEPAEPAGHGEPAIIRRPWPFGCCPTCGDDRFTVGPAQGTAVFTCVGCGASWRYLLGCLIRLDPDPTSPSTAIAIERSPPTIPPPPRTS